MRRIIFTSLVMLLVLKAAAQTVINYDISPGKLFSMPVSFTEFKGRLYFVANDSLHGNELHSIDTDGMPRRELDLSPGIGSGCYGPFSIAPPNFGFIGVPPSGSMAIGTNPDNTNQALYFYGTSDPMNYFMHGLTYGTLSIDMMVRAHQ